MGDIDWQHIDWNHAFPYILPLVAVAIIVRRQLRNAPRKVSPGRMFIVPLIFGAGAIVTIAYSPAPPLFWIVGYTVALALGAGVGFLTTHHQEFAVDEAGQITAKATPIGTILVLGLFAARYAMRFIAPQPVPGIHAHPSADFVAWTDAGLIFATAMACRARDHDVDAHPPADRGA
ncbi:MAG TPA: hypothetical protein VGF56_02715 [Rhizomicrobium sp.]|jgi:hypothetical protein